MSEHEVANGSALYGLRMYEVGQKPKNAYIVKKQSTGSDCLPARQHNSCEKTMWNSELLQDANHNLAAKWENG